MSDFLTWERQPLEQTDDEVLKKYDRFLDIVHHGFAQNLIQQALAARTILAALRHRRLKMEPPKGLEPLASTISNNWKQPDFGLGTQYRWIIEFDELLTGDTPFDLERKTLEVTWSYAKRLADSYQFSFEAVLLYLIRWEVVYRWTRRDATVGQRRFDELVAEAMGEYTEMFTIDPDSHSREEKQKMENRR